MALFAFSGVTAPATAVATTTAEEPPSISVTLTGYNAVPAQTKPDPSTTANGGPSNPEVVAARSRDLGKTLPFGTIIEIVGPASPKLQDSCGYGPVKGEIGYRVITDTMNAKFSDRIDVLLPDAPQYKTADEGYVNPAVVLGICSDVSIRVVGHIDLTNPYDLPTTQAALAAIVAAQEGGSPLALR